jgi:hypothetical protein
MRESTRTSGRQSTRTSKRQSSPFPWFGAIVASVLLWSLLVCSIWKVYFTTL